MTSPRYLRDISATRALDDAIGDPPARERSRAAFNLSQRRPIESGSRRYSLSRLDSALPADDPSWTTLGSLFAGFIPVDPTNRRLRNHAGITRADSLSLTKCCIKRAENPRRRRQGTSPRTLCLPSPRHINGPRGIGSEGRVPFIV